MWAGLERCLMHSEVIFFFVRCAGVFFIVGGCTGMSLLVCASMEMRVRYLEELWNHLQRLSGEIRCISTPLPEAFRVLEASAGPRFSAFFADVGQRLRQGEYLGDIWGICVDRHFSDSALKAEDIRLIEALGSRLGGHDRKMQLDALSLVMETLKRKIDGLTQKNDSQKKVYGGLWIFGGLFLVILLI